MKKVTTLQIALCGPGDVLKEIQITKEVIDEWNQKNFDSRNCGLKPDFWATDVAPSMEARGQSVINRDMIDKADILVAIFWRRLGTPTGMHDSGTVEEVQRAIVLNKPVLLYFSDLEDTKSSADPEQMQRLTTFRDRAMSAGLPRSFRSRQQFRKLFETNLNDTVSEVLTRLTTSKPAKDRTPRPAAASQTITGSNNLQLSGDGNTITFKAPKPPKVTITPPLGSLQPDEKHKVSQWMEDLSVLFEEVKGKSIAQSKSELWSRLKNAFKVSKYEQIRSSQMPEVERWYNIVKAELMQGAKKSSPQVYVSRTIPLIKAAMGRLGRSKVDYYPEIAIRLKMRKFTSLKQVSAKNLERILRLVRNDEKK